MKLSDYVIDFFVRLGVHHSFLVSGGAVIHLVDSCAKHPQMQPICSQHEQLGACSADMYARVSGKLGLMLTTSGPGATNIVTSVSNAYFDSVPLVCLTGQVARFRIKKSPKLRQKGFQETDVVSIFQSITKYTTLVLDPLSIRYELEKAVYMATEGRPGPVVLDIPDDLQRVEIDPATLKGFEPPKTSSPNYENQISSLLKLIEGSHKPVLIYGLGVRCAKAEKEAREFAEFFGIPVVLTWGGNDLFPADHPLNMGGVGVCGPRGGNFAVQNADLIIAMGTRLSQMVTGGKQNLFAPHAKKIMIDVDEEELTKFSLETFTLDLPIQAHLKDFFVQCAPYYQNKKEEAFSFWREKIRSWTERYPVYSPTKVNLTGRVDPYFFIKELSHQAQKGDIIIGDTGANLSWTLQAFETKEDQKIYSAWNHTPMGYSLPASIGAALLVDTNVICLIGDGGFMMCLQELATIKRHNLPIRIFIFDNQGHGIQKQTIDTWLNSHYVAVDHESGLSFPDYELIAKAFHIPYFSLKNDRDVSQNLTSIWNHPGPFICNVEVIQNQKIVPMLKFGAGLEDLDPKLPADELKAIMEEGAQLEKLLT